MDTLTYLPHRPVPAVVPPAARAGNADGPQQVQAVSIASPGSTTPARGQNDDNFLFIDAAGTAAFLQSGQPVTQPRPDWPPGRVRLAVLDGVGKHGSGQQVSTWLAKRLVQMPCLDQAEAMWQWLDDCHTQTRKHFAPASPEQPQPCTTLLLLEILPEGLAWLYHVGDSRLWQAREGESHLLTVDHCLPTAALAAGRIDYATWAQQVLLTDHSAITRAFGLGTYCPEADTLVPELLPQTLPAPLHQLADRRVLAIQPGDTLLLATDGLWCCHPADMLAALQAQLGQGSAAPLQTLQDTLLARQQALASAAAHIADNTTLMLYRH